MNISLQRTALLVGSAVLVMACSKTQEPSSSTPASSASVAAKPVTAATPAAPQPFEGEIVVAVKDEAAKKLPATITYDVKGNKVRYVPAAAPVRAISDLDAQRVYAIDDSQKTFDQMDVKPAPTAKPATAAATPKVQKSGKTEKVAGLDCEDWTIDDGTEKVDVCASKGIAYFDLASEPKPGNTETAWATALTTEKAFPLRVVVHDKAGKEQYRAEATKADAKKLDDAIFQVPNGYKKADLAKETKTASLP
ncbi:MAG TPA: DUF4412 domain-containing protein [Polyangiaceae bacterium]